MKIADLQGARIAVLGLGLEGQAVLQALGRKLPGQMLHVHCEQAPQADQLAQLHNAQLHVGPFAAAGLDSYDVLIKSPGISLYHAAIVQAAAAGVAITSGSNIWFSERAHERVIAITGTKGKSTTAALTAHLLRSAGLQVQLAGNIGVPLISLLDASADAWVLELSSFQIADLRASIEVAVLLSLFDEHLDWHRGASQYRADKLRLLAMARRKVLIASSLRDSIAGELPPQTVAAIEYFGAETSAWQIADQQLLHSDGRCLSTAGLALRGRHNLLNACAALTIADRWAITEAQLQRGLLSFTPLAHRLQTVAQNARWTFVNDSIATTPMATVMAWQALAGEKICLIAGGFDRGLSWDVLLDELIDHPPHALFGLPDTGAALVQALQQRLQHNGQNQPAGGLCAVASLQEAFQRLPEPSDAGLTVLLSPGAASFSQFRNFEQRGATFADLAQAMIRGESG